VQEAKAASALNHPNIVHIYDIGEADGFQFIAMEYVAGKTLDQIIEQKGLRVNEAVRDSVQIADALAKTHSAGIIHAAANSNPAASARLVAAIIWSPSTSETGH